MPFVARLAYEERVVGAGAGALADPELDTDCVTAVAPAPRFESEGLAIVSTMVVR